MSQATHEHNYISVDMSQLCVKITRIRTADERFGASLSLMHDSFVDDELRLDDELRTLTDNNPLFSYNVIEDSGDERIGVITTWNFGKCLYVEHFAIEPARRGAGYGGAVINKLTEISRQPIILEVEPPEMSVDAARRVSFYEKLGFAEWQTPYIQPAYAEGKKPVPMMLMSKGLAETLECAGVVTALLHKHVYGVKSPASLATY